MADFARGLQNHSLRGSNGAEPISPGASYLSKTKASLATFHLSFPQGPRIKPMSIQKVLRCSHENAHLNIRSSDKETGTSSLKTQVTITMETESLPDIETEFEQEEVADCAVLDVLQDYVHLDEPFKLSSTASDIEDVPDRKGHDRTAKPPVASTHPSIVMRNSMDVGTSDFHSLQAVDHKRRSTDSSNSQRKSSSSSLTSITKFFRDMGEYLGLRRVPGETALTSSSDSSESESDNNTPGPSPNKVGKEPETDGDNTAPLAKLTKMEKRAWDKKLKKMDKQMVKITMKQKLYFDISIPGDYHRSPSHEFRSYRQLHGRRLSESVFQKIIRGDGISSANMGSSIDCVVNTPSVGLKPWKREQFQPAMRFPNLYHMAIQGEVHTMIKQLPHLVRLYETDNSLVKEVRATIYRDDGRTTLGDVMNWKPQSRRQCEKTAGAIRLFLKSNYSKTHLPTCQQNELRMNVESLMGKEIPLFAEGVVEGYIDALNTLTDFSMISKHHTDEIYLSAYNSFTKLAFMDLGYLVISFVGLSPSMLDPETYPTGGEGHERWGEGFIDSLDRIEQLRRSKRSRFPGHSLVILQTMIAYFNSPSFISYVLRRVLYWVDNVEVEYIAYEGRRRQLADDRRMKLAVTVSRKVVERVRQSGDKQEKLGT